MRHRTGSGSDSESDEESDSESDGEDLLSALDAIVTALFSQERGANDQDEDADSSGGFNSCFGNGSPGEEGPGEEPSSNNEEALEALSAALGRFNRTPLAGGKRWILLPLASTQGQAGTTALFRILLDQAGPDGTPCMISLAAEISRSGRLWSVRLPRGLCEGAPLVISVDQKGLLEDGAIVARAEALAASLGLKLRIDTKGPIPTSWPSEWGESFIQSLDLVH